MNPNLMRPLLLAVAGAVLAAGVPIGATPASAAPAPSGTSTGGPGASGPRKGDTTNRAPSARAADDPALTDPALTDPALTDPASTDPASTDPASTDPALTDQAPTPPEGTDPVDTTAPTGSFQLSLGSLWVGQQTSLTQVSVADDGVVDPAAVTRVVSWGDGTRSTLRAGQGPIAKQYTAAGRFTVTFTLTDAAGNSAVKSSTVTVTVPGMVKPSKSVIWPREIFTVNFSRVPSGTTKITLDWGDGWISDHKGVNQSVRGTYYHRKNGGLMRGTVTLRVKFTNRNGTTSWIPAGKVSVRTDSWKPVVKVTKPSKANRARSWKTVKGKVSDRGSGAPYVHVWVTRVTGNKTYCFTPKKKWVRIHSEAQYDSTCWSVVAKASKGKWSMKLGGVKKGTLYVDVRTWDGADNASKWSSLKIKVTR